MTQEKIITILLFILAGAISVIIGLVRDLRREKEKTQYYSKILINHLERLLKIPL